MSQQLQLLKPKAKRERLTAGKCSTKWCRGTRGRRTDGRYLRRCWKCHSRQLKARHLDTYYLNILRGSARKRSLTFTLTLPQWRAFCTKTGFLAKAGARATGKRVEGWSIDRINRNRGYSIDNIRVRHFVPNSRDNGTCVISEYEPW